MIVRTKQQRSKLDPYTDDLLKWFGEEKASLVAVQQRLAERGLSVGLSQLSMWWKVRQQRVINEKLVNTIASTAQLCRDVEAEFGENPPPQLEVLIKLMRVTLMNLAARDEIDPELIKTMMAYMKPVMEWAQLEEKRLSRELAENKFKESLRSKIQAGFDAMAEHVRDNPEANTALLNFRATLEKATE